MKHFERKNEALKKSAKASKGSNDQILHKTQVPSLDAVNLRSNLL